MNDLTASTPSVVLTASAPDRKREPKRRGRDGLFQRNGWWWIDCTGADGKRHRKRRPLTTRQPGSFMGTRSAGSLARSHWGS